MTIDTLSPEEIASQHERLVVYRRTLSDYLSQEAALGAAYAPPGVAYGINDTRIHIRSIKPVLRLHGIHVEEHIDDSSRTLRRLLSAGDRLAVP